MRNYSGALRKLKHLVSLSFTKLAVRDFYAEVSAVACGTQVHKHGIRPSDKTSGHMRRNIHRLEKGLIMPNRKEIFAEDYIEETVNLFTKASSVRAFDQSEREWARDVLAEYFKHTKSTPKIEAAQKKYTEFERRAVSEEPSKRIPYLSSNRTKASVQEADLEALFLERRSVRFFDDAKVPSEVIQRAVELASLAPSACNRQPFRFLAFSRENRIRSLMKLPPGTRGFGSDVPNLIVAIGDLSCFSNPRDRHLIYTDTALATMQLMLALQVLGVSSCPINWPDDAVREEKFRKEVAIKQHERPIIYLAFGYPKDTGGIPFSQKKSVGSLLELET
ncbi:nitroreductase family protein [Tranquillimonas rosea]|uniref:nitroreductase family protein n=1 Tax=Tranquillimonas rosea TaxID=641238 RepID=UPI003BA92322